MSEPLTSPADALGLVGRTIEQVRFDACVDAGGFGLIYRGYHLGLDEVVAIKCLRIAAIQQTNAEMREALAGRFRDETKLLYRLSQGNLDIVRCIGSGTLVAPSTHEYTPYMVLEWLDGCTLSAELRDRRTKQLGGRTLEQAIRLLDSAALGLAYAHGHDVVHRDVKPGNLFLARTREGVRMKVLDFGLAKILSDEAIGIRPSVATGIGVHFCSPSYGAPEQFSGQVGPIGPWTDVYSLALVLLEVLLGTKVRPASSFADGLLKALQPESGSPRASALGLSLPPAVEDLLHRALALDPRSRPHDASVFWAGLKVALTAQLPDLSVTLEDDDAQPAPPFQGTMLMPSAAPPDGNRDTAPLAPPLAKTPSMRPVDSPTLTLPFRDRPPQASASQPPYASTAPPPYLPAPPERRPSFTTDPRLGLAPPPARKGRGSAGGWAVLLFVALALLAGALYWLRFRGHPG